VWSMILGDSFLPGNGMFLHAAFLFTGSHSLAQMLLVKLSNKYLQNL